MTFIKNPRQKALDILTASLQEAEMRQGCTNHSYYAEIILKQLEPFIFNYAPLPLSIQEALNSGDGVYRP